ncbi:MAG: hypothetical protein CVU46_12670, partial [Chloroflexi bacterium HGW-Chloroflexi-8]
VLIVIGASFAMGTVGVTAGTASLILGQLLISGIVDSLGWGGQAPIPFSWQRILGLLLMGIAIFLLVPKSK